MSWFLALLRKELAFWFRRPGVHLFALLFFVLGLLTMLSMSGLIDFIQVGGSGGLKKIDSVHNLTMLTLVFNLFATMNMAAAAGGASTRDVTEGSHPLVFSTPVPKLTFLGSRYLGALIVSAYLVAAIPAGLMFGRLLPIFEPERIGAFDPLTTLACVAAWEVPNLVLVTALFFGIGAVTRRMFPIYLGGVLLFVGYLGAGAFLEDLDDRSIGVMLDPFGLIGIGDVTRYWSAEQSNTLIPWPTGTALAARVLWLCIGLGTLAGGLALTRLDQDGWSPLARFTRKETSEATELDAALPVPSARRSFGLDTRFAQLAVLCRRSVLDVVGHRYFWGFVGASVLFQLLNAQAIGSMYGTDTLPVTYQVADVLYGTLQLFVLLVLTFYAGDLVWAERDNGQAQLLDSSPIPDAAFLIAKLLALTVLVVALHLIPLVIGPLVQLFHGYTVFEPVVYLQYAAFSVLDWVPYIALALAVHVIANQKMAGHAILIGFWGLTIFRVALGFEHNLFWLGSDPGKRFSDMNGWGHALGAFLIHKAYWTAFALLAAGVARLFWVRGVRTFRDRLAAIRERMDRPTVVLLSTSGVAFVGLFAWIGWQTNVVGTYRTSIEVERRTAAFERAFKEEWEGAPHPLITAIDTNVDLYPDEGRAEVQATFALRNDSGERIERMLVDFPDDGVEVHEVTLSNGFREVFDETFEVRVWTLERPMEPGETSELTFRVTYLEKGMPNSGFEQAVVPNGSMLHHYLVFPSFGYDRGSELSDPADRRTQGLPERDRMRDLDDPLARAHNYVTDDAHRLELTSRVSTKAGQIPMAPGDLVDQGTDGDRVWRVYRPDDPVLYLFAFLSADWEVTRSEEGPVPVEVYSWREHPYNVERMLDAMNRSLAMYQRDFGPFQHEVLRIIEFPRYASYAQSLPAMVPFSEAIGFIAQLNDPEEDIDYVTYVTAHEVAHQWWAHQVCGGDGQGATVLTESLSQYSAFKVMAELYGLDEIQRFLEYEEDRYFMGRANERDKELPLIRVENQPYIHYQKGGIVLWTLSEHIGRERFDAALRTFLETWRYRGPPYPTARDFVEHLKASFPEHTALIEDGFERIVHYDLRAEGAVIRDGDVVLTVHAERIEADAEGRETRTPFSGRVLVEAEDAQENKVRTEVELHPGENRIHFDGMPTPTKVSLDPRALWLEQDRDDNTAWVEQGEG